MVRQSFLTALTVSLMLCLPLADSWGRGFGGGGGRGGGGGGGFGGGGGRSVASVAVEVAWRCGGGAGGSAGGLWRWWHGRWRLQAESLADWGAGRTLVASARSERISAVASGASGRPVDRVLRAPVVAGRAASGFGGPARRCGSGRIRTSGLGGFGGPGQQGRAAIDSRPPAAANSTVSWAAVRRRFAQRRLGRRRGRKCGRRAATRGSAVAARRRRWRLGGVGVGGDAGSAVVRAGAGAGGVGRLGEVVPVASADWARCGVGVRWTRQWRWRATRRWRWRPGVGVGGVGGLSPVSASARYTTATAVRTNYNHWGFYGRDWYGRYPGAWSAAGWAAGAAWSACTWGTAAAYCGYAETPPVYYDYGNNVTYQDNNVYVNGDNAGTAEQYYDQAASLASTGAAAEAPADGDWLPLGVFALTKSDQTKSDVSIQLAVNKQGVIRGNYTDTATNKNQVVQGSVDKQTQRVAFTVGDNTTNVVETGLYNLTKDEAPCLIHFGKDKTRAVAVGATAEAGRRRELSFPQLEHSMTRYCLPMSNAKLLSGFGASRLLALASGNRITLSRLVW